MSIFALLPKLPFELKNFCFRQLHIVKMGISNLNVKLFVPFGILLGYFLFRGTSLFYDNSIPSEFSLIYQPLYRCSVVNSLFFFQHKSNYHCFAENRQQLLDNSKLIFGPVIQTQFSTYVALFFWLNDSFTNIF